MMKKNEHSEQDLGDNKGSGEKTFLTMPKVDGNLPYTLHDLLFPAGKVAKLCKITDSESPSLKFRDVLNKFGYQQPTPVIILAGAKDANRSKFYAGICRAAFRTDAVIVDSGIKSGIEQFTLRRNLILPNDIYFKEVKLVGVFPEAEIKLPKVNPTEREWNELANGHTHLFMLCETASKQHRWSDEADIKIKVAKKISEGTVKTKFPSCKIVTVVMGDLEQCIQDIILSIANNLPVIVVPGSTLCNNIIKYINQDEDHGKLPSKLTEALDSETAHVYSLEENNSEEIASFLHFFLTVTPF